jgi:hypothetical protein
MKTLASDLSTFLKVVGAPSKKVEQAPQAPVLPVKQQVEAVDPTTDPAALVRAAWDYVSSKLDEHDDAHTIGEAFMLAVSALSQDAAVDRDQMNSAAIDFLESIVEAAREAL